MEIVQFAHTLWRRRIAVAVGVIAAAAVLLAGPRAKATASGVAYTRVALDTPSSQLVRAAPAGAGSLGWRASLLAHLVATDATRRGVATRAGIPAAQLSVLDPTLAVPAVPASLPKGVADATATVSTPYVLSVYGQNGSLPIITIEGAGPDRKAAAGLVRAAATVLESQSSRAGGGTLQPFEVQSVASVHARTVIAGGGLLRSVIASVLLLGVWCAAVALARPRSTARRQRRRAGSPGAENRRAAGRCSGR